MSEAIPWSFPKLEYTHPNQQHQMPRKEAEAIIQRAYIEAEQMKRDILQEAESEAAFLKERTREQAFMEGYEEGRQQALAELQKERSALKQSVLQQWEELHNERQAQWSDLMEGLTQRVGQLALCISEKLIEKSEVEKLPTKQIRKALESISDGGSVEVLVHPDDKTQWPAHLSLTLIADDGLSPGEFHLKGPHGSVDGSWETRWRRIREILEVEEV